MGAMELAAPHALSSDVLHKGREMIKDRMAQLSSQTRDLDILHAVNFVPVVDQIIRRAAADKKSLAAKNRVRSNNKRAPGNIAGENFQTRVIKSSQRQSAFSQWRPIEE